MPPLLHYWTWGMQDSWDFLPPPLPWEKHPEICWLEGDRCPQSSTDTLLLCPTLGALVLWEEHQYLGSGINAAVVAWRRAGALVLGNTHENPVFSGRRANTLRIGQGL